MRTAKQRAEAKGRYLEKLAKALLESWGETVELAGKQLFYLFDPKTGKRFARSRRHDFFGVWDAIRAQGPVRCFAQVTTLHNAAVKRSTIRRSGFAPTPDDLILGYEGRSRWRLLRGPLFEMPGETITYRPKRRTTHGHRVHPDQQRARQAPEATR